eukprot:6212004-Pleurochrysis_carterae.AAC.5
MYKRDDTYDTTFNSRCALESVRARASQGPLTNRRLQLRSLCIPAAGVASSEIHARTPRTPVLQTSGFPPRAAARLRRWPHPDGVCEPRAVHGDDDVSARVERHLLRHAQRRVVEEHHAAPARALRARVAAGCARAPIRGRGGAAGGRVLGRLRSIIAMRTHEARLHCTRECADQLVQIGESPAVAVDAAAAHLPKDAKRSLYHEKII